MVVWLVFGTILLIISINDFLFFRIENEYVIFLLCLYLISYISGISGSNFLNALKVFALVFAVTCFFNRYNMIGGGDIKLLFPMLLFAEDNVQAFLIGISIGGINYHFFI